MSRSKHSSERNWVAKNDFNVGGAHKDKRRESNKIRGEKHKKDLRKEVL